MSPLHRALEVTVLGIIAVVAACCQRHQWCYDRQLARLPPRRLFVPLLVSGVVALGFLVQGLLHLTDIRKLDFGLGEMVELLVRALVFALLLNIKVLGGPLFLGYSLAAGWYCFCEHGQWELWPLLDLLFDWVFDSCPAWLKYGYFSLTSAYALASSVVGE